MHVVLLLDLWCACQARTRKIQMKKDEDDTICAKADTKNIWAYIISHKLWLRFLLSVMLADGIARIPHSIRSCTALLSQISLSYTVILGWKQSRTVFATGFRTRRTDCSSQAGFQAQADCKCLTSNRFRVWLYCFRVSPKKHFFLKFEQTEYLSPVLKNSRVKRCKNHLWPAHVVHVYSIWDRKPFWSVKVVWWDSKLLRGAGAEEGGGA